MLNLYESKQPPHFSYLLCPILYLKDCESLCDMLACKKGYTNTFCICFILTKIYCFITGSQSDHVKLTNCPTDVVEESSLIFSSLQGLSKLLPQSGFILLFERLNVNNCKEEQHYVHNLIHILKSLSQTVYH